VSLCRSGEPISTEHVNHYITDGEITLASLQIAASLHPVGAVEVDLVPAKVADLCRPEPLPIGDEESWYVAIAVPVAAGRLQQGLDPGWREVLPGSQVGVLLPSRSNCSFAKRTGDGG
jgi:hypothetical protein